MPFTPYHLGPGLFVGLLFLSFIDFPTFLVASVIVDVEPFMVLALNLNYPLHEVEIVNTEKPLEDAGAAPTPITATI